MKKNNHGKFQDVGIAVEQIPCPGCLSEKFEYITETLDYDYFTSKHYYKIVQCSECELLYVNPRPKLSEIEKIYPEQYSAYHFKNIKNPVIRKARSFMQSKKAQTILKCMPELNRNARIVDVGCGNAVLLEMIRDASPEKLKLYGNDFSSDALNQVKQAGFEIIPGNFENIEWEENYFDVIIMNQVIEHLFDIPGILRKSFSLLRSGGTLLIETPSSDGLDACLFRKSNWGGYHVPRHLQIFSRKTISATLLRYGFVAEKISYLPSPNFWTSSFRNLFFTKGFPRFVTGRMNYKNFFCMALFTSVDLITRNFVPTSNMRVIVRKPI